MATINSLTSLTTPAANDLLAIWDSNAGSGEEPTKKMSIGDFVVNNLTSTSTTQPLSAAQGKTLNDYVTTYESVTFTPGNNVTINSQGAFRYGKILFVYMRWTATSTISAYGTIAENNYAAKTWWNAPLMNDDNTVVANNGIYGDIGNYQIRASTNISAGTYRSYAVIPIT